MDIDDILREADPDFYSEPRDGGDLQALINAWSAERSAPELLEYVLFMVVRSSLLGDCVLIQA